MYKIILFLCIFGQSTISEDLPVFIATWAVGRRTVQHGYDLFTNHNYTLMDAVMYGLSDVCETQRCSGSVGAYGVIDENGLPSLDGMIMRGSDNRIGAAANVKSVKEVTQVARAVLDYTRHTFMAGSDLDQFASDMGLNLTNLTNNATWARHEAWRNRSCQNNHRMNVLPDPRTSCGPYRPDPNYRTSTQMTDQEEEEFELKDGDGNWNHDTVCMIGVDKQHRMVVATSTNGLGAKVPGRIADTPVPGAGGYVDDDVGGAAATGNGDVMMRFLPAFQIVEAMMLLGMTPQQAAEYAIYRIARKAGPFNGALIAINNKGEHGGSCYGLRNMSYAVRTAQMENTTQIRRPCITLETYVPPPTVPPASAPPCGHAGTVMYSALSILLATVMSMLISVCGH